MESSGGLTQNHEAVALLIDGRAGMEAPVFVEHVIARIRSSVINPFFLRRESYYQ